VLRALLSLPAEALLQDGSLRAGESLALEVGSQLEVFRALVSDAFVHLFDPNVFAVADDLVALSVLQFVASGARDSDALSLHEAESFAAAGPHALVSNGLEALFALRHADFIDESESGWAAGSLAGLFDQSEVLRAFSSGADVVLEGETFRAAFSGADSVLEGEVLRADSHSADAFDQSVLGRAGDSDAFGVDQLVASRA